MGLLDTGRLLDVGVWCQNVPTRSGTGEPLLLVAIAPRMRSVSFPNRVASARGGLFLLLLLALQPPGRVFLYLIILLSLAHGRP